MGRRFGQEDKSFESCAMGEGRGGRKGGRGEGLRNKGRHLIIYDSRI